MENEIGGAGYIRNITFDMRSAAAATADSVKIYLGKTSMTAHPTASVSTWVPMDSLTLVFSATNWAVPQDTAALSVTLDNPYYYNGEGTLVMVISKAAGTASTNTRFGYTSTTATIKYTGGTTESYCLYPTVAGSNSMYKINVRFGMTTTATEDYCAPVENFHLSDLGPSSITIAWDAVDGESYEVGYTTADGTPDDVSATTVTGNSFTFTGLDAVTNYKVYLRHVCGGTNSGWQMLSARTLALPVSIPVNYTFESGDNDGDWSVLNSANGWFIGSLGEGRALFVSNDSGATNAYTINSGQATSWAWIDANFEEGGYAVSFDWKCYGESNYDYMRAFIVPSNVIFATDHSLFTTHTSTGSRNQVPDGWLLLGSKSDDSLYFNMRTSWQHFGGEFTIATAGLYHIVFMWSQDASLGNQPPAAIDNISIVSANCFAPAGFSLDTATISASSVTVNFDHPSATDFLMMWREVGETNYDTVVMTSASYEFTGLRMGTTYEGIIYTICGSDTSVGYMPFEFMSGCDAITEDDLPFSETFEAYGSGSTQSINGCWHKQLVVDLGSTTTQYPYPYSTAAINGNRGLYFYASHSSTTNFHSYAVLPPVAEDLEMNELQVDFLMKRNASSSSTTSTYNNILIVGIAENDSLDNFTAIDTIDISGELANTVRDVEVQFVNYTGNGRYVVLLAPDPGLITSYNYNTVYVDDVTLRKIPTCYRPTQVSAAVVGPDEVTLSWTPDSRTANPSSWTVEIGLQGFTPGEGEGYTASDTTITISGLTANTEYDVYVSAMCGSESSDPRSYTFRTACDEYPTDSLPFYEDFETYGTGSTAAISPCWHKGTNASTNYPYPYSSTPISGIRSLYFYGMQSATAAYYSYAALPLFEADVNTLQISFRTKKYSTSSSSTTLYGLRLAVGVMSNPNDITTFDTVAIIDRSEDPSNSIDSHSVSLSYYSGEGRYIAFLVMPIDRGSHTTSYNYVKVDSVLVDLLPSCTRPEYVEATGITANGATIAWRGEADSYEVEYSANADFTASQTVTTTDTTTTLGGLTDYSYYYVRVRSNCNGIGTSTWSDILTLQTAMDCGANSINIQSNIGEGSSATSTYAFYTSTSYANAFTSTIYTAAEMEELGLQDNNLIHSIKLHAGSTGGTIRQARVYMAETTNEGYGTPAANDTTDRNTMTLVYSGDLEVQAGQWVEIMLNTPFAYSGSNNLLITLAHDTNTTAAVTFYYHSSSPDYLSCYSYRSTTGSVSVTRSYSRPDIFFNICTTVPPCPRPQHVAVTGTTDSSATIAWDGSSALYEVAYSTAVFHPDSTTGYSSVQYTASPATLTGLAGNTTYHFYVRALCGDDGNSSWSAMGSFTTQCAPQLVPYFEDFEGYASGSTADINSCWTRYCTGTTAYPYPSTTAVSGSRSLYFAAYHASTASSTYYSYTALPQFQANLNQLQLSFAVRRYSTVSDYYTSRLVVGVMDNPDDIATFTPIDTIDLKSAEGSSIHRYDVSFAAYAGTGKHIALYDEVPPLYGSSSYCYSYLYVDDIEVNYIPTCARVSGVSVDNIGTTTATVHWTPVEGVSSYTVEYGPAGFIHGNGTQISATGDSLNLTGLPHSTNLDIYVRAHCSATDAGAWSFVECFATDCAPNSLPLFYDPDDYPNGTSAPLPLCWTRLNNGSSSSYPYIYSSAANAHTGTNVLYFYLPSSSTPNEEAMVLPEIDTSLTPIFQTEVAFWAKASVTNRKLYLGVVSDPVSLSSIDIVDSVVLSLIPTEYVLNASSYGGSGTRLALYAKRDTTATVYYYVDDITVEVISACPRAYNLTAHNATATSVVLQWADSTGSTQWKVSYAPENGNTWTEVTVTNNVYTLTGLTANSFYRYRVASICSEGTQADWSRQICHFGTSQIPATVPYSYDFEQAAEWDNWQTLSNNQYTWQRGNAVAQSGSAMYLSNDGGATHSWNTALTTNAVAFRDIDFGSTPVSYQLDFDAYVGGATDAFYDGMVVFVVDPASTYQASDNAITTPWGSVNDIEWLGYARHDSVWTHHTFYLDGMSGVKRLVFYHFNNAGADHPRINIPSAVDNVSLSAQTCVRPYDLAAATLPTSVTLSWQGNANDLYMVAYRESGTSAAYNVYDTVTGTSITISGLSAMTRYNAWVRHICSISATDTVASPWSSGLAFATPQPPVTSLPYSTSFEVGDDRNWVLDNGELTNHWVIGDATYTGEGSSSLYISNDNIGSNAYTATSKSTVFAYRTFQLGMGEYALSYNWTAHGESNYDFLRVWVIPEALQPAASEDLPAGFPSTAASYCVYTPTGWIDVTGGAVKLNLQDSWQTVQDTFMVTTPGRYNLVFMWRNDASVANQAPAAVDNVSVTALSSCETPAIVQVTPAIYSATLTFTGTATEYEVALMQGEWNEEAAVPVSVTDYIYQMDSLLPSTQYAVGVRAKCMGVYRSEWDAVSFTTLEPPCELPTAVTASDVTYTSAVISFSAAEGQTAWEAHVAGPGIDSTYALSATTFSVSGLSANTTYGVQVRALCSATSQSGWTDVVSFTTQNCQPVSGVSVSDITAHTATVSWNSTGASGYEVEYGMHGFSQGLGTIVQSAGNSVTLTGLEDDSPYDVYVRSLCTTGAYSTWSEASFTTLEDTPVETYYTVTVSVNDASMGTVSGGGTYAEGSTCTLTANANNGFRFVKWDDEVSTNPRTFIVTANVSFTAIFEQMEGIDEAGCEQMAAVSIYPNPATHVARVECGEWNVESVEVIDMNGRIVLRQQFLTPQTSVTLDVTALSSGAYFVRLTGEQSILVRKLMIK
jgi:hypothetical protein